jgi:hypothetical protein
MTDLQTLPVLNDSQLRELILQVDPTTMDCRTNIAKLRSRLNHSYDNGAITSREFRSLVAFMADFHESCLGSKLDDTW